jgi:hypothetical protein
MPTPDPIPPLAPIRRQFLRIMRLGALFSIVIAAIAVILVAKGDSSVRVHMLIATALGTGLSVLLGIALMSLVFLSNRLGQDDAAADHQQKEEHDPRS